MYFTPSTFMITKQLDHNQKLTEIGHFKVRTIL